MRPAASKCSAICEEASHHEIMRYLSEWRCPKPRPLPQFEQVRRSGIGFDDGEFDAEARCVAVPVRDFTGQVASAIGISGPIWRLSL